MPGHLFPDYFLKFHKYLKSKQDLAIAICVDQDKMFEKAKVLWGYQYNGRHNYSTTDNMCQFYPGHLISNIYKDTQNLNVILMKHLAV